MRRWFALAGMAAFAGMASFTALAQSPAGLAVTRGTLLERDTQTPAGEFAVRTAGSQVLRYRYDARTAVADEELRLTVPNLAPGESVEVDSIGIEDSPLRYARSIRVIAEVKHAPQRRVPTFVPLHHFTLGQERLMPEGDLTYSGVIGEIAGLRLLLHTRDAGDQTILLRKDTRYLENGATVSAAALRTNQRVFVRAGKNPYGQIEGYQVIWGSILNPE